MSPFEVYWLFMLPGLKISLITFVVFTAVITIVFVAIEVNSGKPDAEINKACGRKALIGCAVAVLFILGAALLPNDKALLRMVGAYVVTNIEDIEKLPPNLVGAANRLLEELRRDNP